MDEKVSFWDAIMALENRPECEHHLNGPCIECGDSLNLAEALAWQEELRELGILGLDSDHF